MSYYTKVPNKDMIELTWTQLRHMAGIDAGDTGLVQDVKLWDWLGSRKYRIITVEDRALERDRARTDGIEVLIIKE